MGVAVRGGRSACNSIWIVFRCSIGLREGELMHLWRFVLVADSRSEHDTI